jgi:hypothetical protein
LGELTTWRLQAINQLATTLHLLVLVQSPSAAASPPATYKPEYYSKTNLVAAQPIVYHPVHAQSLYNLLKVPKSRVIILDNDIRLGPLEPNSVYETELRLIGVARGVSNLDGIKVFDTNTGDGLDFGKLVELFVV